ncbi:hypothetical protein SESBI_18450 [Sesbania bispinosa]|nr:hypothetical protein SESBI_18450 [Sesbania bispinosa]
MVMWLQGFMGDLITHNRSAFVGGHIIQDNILVAHEAFSHAQKEEGMWVKGVAVKLDMNKVYDTMEWSFLESCLLAYGFNDDWVSKVMSLVSTVSYKFKVNGNIQSILNADSRASGQRINVSKLGIIRGRGIQYQEGRRVAHILQIHASVTTSVAPLSPLTTSVAPQSPPLSRLNRQTRHLRRSQSPQSPPFPSFVLDRSLLVTVLSMR